MSFASADDTAQELVGAVEHGREVGLGHLAADQLAQEERVSLGRAGEVLAAAAAEDSELVRLEVGREPHPRVLARRIDRLAERERGAAADERTVKRLGVELEPRGEDEDVALAGDARLQ